MMEGYYEDGSFRYANDPTGEGSYPSHAHGWSTAPAEALVSYVVGVRPTEPGGRTWVLAPQMGDLEAARGGFTTMLGRFEAGWEVERGGYSLWYNTPAETEGSLWLPCQGGPPRVVLMDGRPVKGSHFDGQFGLSELEAPGGRHSIFVRY